MHKSLLFTLLLSSPLSNNHICGGGDHSPDRHLPADQNPHSRRPHPGVQQVSHHLKHRSQSFLLLINLNLKQNLFKGWFDYS